MPNAFCNFQKNVYNFFLSLTAVFSGNFEDTDFYIGPLEAQFIVEYENRKKLKVKEKELLCLGFVVFQLEMIS